MNMVTVSLQEMIIGGVVLALTFYSIGLVAGLVINRTAEMADEALANVRRIREGLSALISPEEITDDHPSEYLERTTRENPQQADRADIGLSKPPTTTTSRDERPSHTDGDRR